VSKIEINVSGIGVIVLPDYPQRAGMVKVGHKTAPGVLENGYLFEGIYQ
jgi:hypothetical protein